MKNHKDFSFYNTKLKKCKKQVEICNRTCVISDN